LKWQKKRTLLIAFGVLLTTFGVLWYHGVDNSLSAEDKKYINLILKDSHIPQKPHSSYASQIATVRAAQAAVLMRAPKDMEIPSGRNREPKDLYTLEHGLCFDRSRVIEKTLRLLGFETRHIFFFKTEGANRFPLKLFYSPLSSHAVTEVKTRKGWLVVDSNYKWISLKKDNTPVSIEEIRSSGNEIEFLEPLPNSIYHHISFLYGLYSRHGKYYPPFNRIPDIHYGEFMDNFF
jgi:hypothetical protein